MNSPVVGEVGSAGLTCVIVRSTTNVGAGDGSTRRSCRGTVACCPGEIPEVKVTGSGEGSGQQNTGELQQRRCARRAEPARRTTRGMGKGMCGSCRGTVTRCQNQSPEPEVTGSGARRGRGQRMKHSLTVCGGNVSARSIDAILPY